MKDNKPVSMYDLEKSESEKDKKKKKKEESSFFSKIKGLVSGPTAAEAATGFAERMKKGSSGKK